MGTIKTTNIETITGSGTLTLGQSGETISVPSGATLTVPSGGLSGQNYPAFSVTANGATIPTTAITKVPFDTEIFDTDNAFDTSTYEFTVPTGKGGKYIIGANCRANAVVDDTEEVRTYIYLNNVADIGAWNYSPGTNYPVGAFIEKLYDLSAGDQVEIRFFQTSGSDATLSQTTFYGYRIGS